MAGRGTLFLIVGPSGAGKDSLIQGARESLAGDRDFVFARRAITRPPDPGREAHDALSAKDFAARAKAGGFMVAWNAYDTDYGIPADYADELDAGRHVVANVSRAAAGEAAARFRPARVIQITAPRAVLEQRLVTRGDARTIAERLARSVMLPDGLSVNHLLNTGPLERGIDRLVAMLRTLASG